MNRILAIAFTLCCFQLLFSQDGSFAVNGVMDHRDGHYAFTNATIYKTYNQKITNGTLVIKEGKVVSVSAGSSVPRGAVMIDLRGKTIYPSFIDIYGSYGVPKAKKSEDQEDGPQMESNKKGAYGWNQAIKPENQAHKMFKKDNSSAEKLRKSGFGVINTHQQDGIARGTSAVVLLGDDRENKLFVKDIATANYSFNKGVSTQDYPGSLMGSIALVRQTYLDADWYKKNKYKEEFNISLDAWNQIQKLPQVFEVHDWLTALRADKVGDEFGVQYIIKGKGDEYKRLDAMKSTNAKFIIPISFPMAYDVEDPYDAKLVDLNKMKHWEMAPANLKFMAEKGIDFAITASGLRTKDDSEDFLKNLRRAVKYGLDAEKALKALTYTPASMLNLSKEIGSLQNGTYANFIITSGDIFDKETILFHNWVNGKAFEINTLNVADLRGKYLLTFDKQRYDLQISGKKPTKAKAKLVVNDSTKIDVEHKLKDKAVSLTFSSDKDGHRDKIRLSGWLDDNKDISGKGQLADGKWVKWKAQYVGPIEKDKKDEEDKKPKKDLEISLDQIVYPFLPYGMSEELKAKSFLIKNATVWTCEREGILENADVLIKGGKIAGVGRNLSAPGAIKVDGTGKHVTPGIIDEHSHIAINRGVNEWTQSSSAEVSIADVVNSVDINLYRQLSGGVVAAQLLHGSANPIGGQSALIKFRWGSLPEEMKIKGAVGFIKFALGENVKQSNWGPENTVRFPQTRMGVEQVYVDAFTRAREYGKTKGNSSVRKDLEMETLLEILNKQRFVTCHSYVQSEINMLMKVAERFNFRMNTFTHILEGYKVADIMQAHGVGGSTFSDWWAYKYEVIDAIPHNAAIMNEMGVITALNSDNAEMARRLNQEAAKAVKYGGASEEDALKMVTLNPAKLLHLDDKMGSLKRGKDADVVVWNDHPLSVYAKVDHTFVDGVLLFDKDRDLKLREEIKTERIRLIQKMIDAKSNGEPTLKPTKEEEHHWHCDDIGCYVN